MRGSGSCSSMLRDGAHEQAHERLLDEHLYKNPDGIYSSSSSHGNRRSRGRKVMYIMAHVAVIATCMFALLGAWLYLATRFRDAERCESGEIPSIRREWRSLTSDQRSSYIAALQCLRSTPSHIHPGYAQITRWDDFAWTHYHVGFIAHNAACFLSWHRWFIALFENSLRSDCGYLDPLPYWDWTLDWKHPERAPIFDNEFGLGGNGDFMHQSPADGSWCVENGPFAGARIPFDYQGVAGEEILFDAQGRNTSFCLSRKFAQGDTFNASHLDPQYVSWVLSQTGYLSFLIELEDGPHNDIPFGINGTFLTLYAPEDPIFFLHHGQLDRLWWSWQKSKPGNAYAYDGPSTSQTTAPAKLTNVLPFGDLGEDIAVSDVINTEKKRLCYQYDKVAT